MAEYRLLTIWRIRAPLAEVYEAIYDSLRWPEWWPGAEIVEETAAGDSNGIGSVRRYVWQGDLPYPVVFEVRATRIEALVAIEGDAQGDLAGTGHWHFAQQGEVSIVRYEWHVRTTRRWMNLLAPLARPLFIRNHARIMARGGQGLARRLGATLLSQENIDLLADNGSPRAIAGQREGGRVEPRVLLTLGLGAGILATVAQMTLWRLAGMPVLETLYRDARLTAALLMGPGVLPPPATAEWEILLVATLIHFALSIAYALPPALLAGRLSAAPAVVAGAAYGLGLYVVNLHGFTALFFPWFSVARDWVTLATHLIFGMGLGAGAWWLARGDRQAKKPA